MIYLVFGTVLGTWASYLISLITKKVEVIPFVIIFTITLFFGFLKRRVTKINRLYVLSTLLWFVFFTILFVQILIETQAGIWVRGAMVWGDWAGHMGYVANWLYGDNFPTQNPWYSGIKLSYPFLFDFTSTIIVKLGLSPSWSFQLPGIIFATILASLIYKITEHLTKNKSVAFVSVFLFMFSGGLGFLYLIPGQNLLHVPTGGIREFTHVNEANIQWVNFITAEMVPQRGILVGITAAISSYYLLLKGYKKNNHKLILQRS